MIQIRYYTNQGEKRGMLSDNVESAILDYRKRRKMKEGAQNGEYTIDGGATWLRL